MKEATYVAISTQKGGAGKTTLTVLVASYLHYVKGYNVAVVDCDFPQYSIHDMRKRDMKAVMEDGHYKVMAYEQLKRLKKNPYTIRCSRAEALQPYCLFAHTAECGAASSACGKSLQAYSGHVLLRRRSLAHKFSVSENKIREVLNVLHEENRIQIGFGKYSLKVI